MLFGGNSGSCGGCGCKSCQECTRGCTEPHTGTAFETVYTLYFEGAEAGNPTDGYLDATGDVDTSDPYDGMDGTGPWEQTVSGTFTLTKSTTRYPCYVRVSFWRSNFVLGANTIPPPAATLTTNRITVTNQAASEGAIIVDFTVLQPGESYQLDNAIGLVDGAGDQGANDPRSSQGSVSIRAACANDYVSFTVSGNIAWNVQKRQHVLYGIVRECYEDPDNPPCATVCSGSAPPATLYLTISNAATTSGTFGGTLPNGTYAMDRLPNFCSSYLTWLNGCPSASAFTSYSAVNASFATGGGYVSMNYYINGASECGAFVFAATNAALAQPCGTGTLASGSGTWSWIPQSAGGTPAASGTLDWSVTA